MKIVFKITPVAIVILSLIFSCTSSKEKWLKSPDGNIAVRLQIDNNGIPFYQINYKDNPVILNSRLGIVRNDADFSEGMKLKSVSEITPVTDEYSLLYGKKKHAVYQANKLTYNLAGASGEELDVIFQASNDGVVFRYAFPGTSDSVKKISRELTCFNFAENTHGWIQPRAKSKSGWNQVNPSYEEHYWQDTLLSSVLANDSGWVFPALFHGENAWITITETWPERNYCGSHLNKGNNTFEMCIEFPESSEGFTNGVVYPESKLPWSTPWRIITIGESLSTLAESTLGMDVAHPSVLKNTDYVKPGRASWSWVLLKDPSVNYDTQLEFIDYASEMGWEYCLVDAGWDVTMAWEGIRKLADYAAQKNVKLLLWYNSAGDWNTTPLTPKHRLLTPEKRNTEFAILQEIGIKGIKVDFFGGDGQSMMDYYQDILEDADKYQLMVNCHGATLPRGLQRTYPNLVSMEAIRGLEYATFGQETADKVPTKSTIVTYTRNIFDPMDFTPVCFTDYDNNHRVTGNGAELAQAVIFLSGIQHYAETPEGMKTVPDYVRNMMKEIPVAWDETHFIDGYPGKYIVLARRSGKTWYVAGINAEKTEHKFEFTLPCSSGKPALLITEGDSLRSFSKAELTADKNITQKVLVRSNGGFVIQLEEE